MNRNEAIKFIKFQTEKAAKLSPYKIDVEVKPTDKSDEFEVILTRHYPKPVKIITIEMECDDE